MDHMARAVEAFAGQLDIIPLYAALRAREGTPRHPPAGRRSAARASTVQ